MNDKKRKPYIKWTDQERYNVGVYASQNGIQAAVRHYQSKYKNLNESTVQGLKNCVDKEFEIAPKIKVILERNRSFESREYHLF